MQTIMTLAEKIEVFDCTMVSQVETNRDMDTPKTSCANGVLLTGERKT